MSSSSSEAWKAIGVLQKKATSKLTRSRSSIPAATATTGKPPLNRSAARSPSPIPPPPPLPLSSRSRSSPAQTQPDPPIITDTVNSSIDTMEQISNLYGPNANLYTDVLRVEPTSTQSEIREAFFCLRYDIYQKLSNEPTTDPNSKALSDEERKAVEARMDAITSAFRILADVNKRKQYDASLMQGDNDQEHGAPESDEAGFPVADASPKSSSRSSRLAAARNRSVFRRHAASNNKAAEEDEEPPRPRGPSPINVPGGMNRATPRVVAETVTGGMSSVHRSQNTKKQQEVAPVFSPKGDSPSWAQFDSTIPKQQQPTTVDASSPKILKTTMMMLYKNQMRLHSQQKQQYQQQPSSQRVQSQRPRKIAASHDSEGNRADWLVGSSKSEKNAMSPTGVDGLDSTTMFNEEANERKVTIVEDEDEDNTTRASQQDEDRTYDDDATNYDDDTNYDDTTMGDTLEDTTIGDSSWASYDDDGTSVGDTMQGRYKPSHKNGNKPEPILRSSSNAGAKDKSTDGARRVTIHSHRGKGGNGEDTDFTEMACPFPSLTDIQEEVTGTYKDAKAAFDQVLHAFVISPDDIDRMADKIRDAKVELAENYQKQVKERQLVV
eukprot:g12008.t1 g12008   contig6:1033481-1035399(-)